MKTLAWAAVVVGLLATDALHTYLAGGMRYEGYETVGAFFLFAFIGFVLCAVFSA